MAGSFETFAALHVPGNPVVLYNIWDVGSALAVVKAGAKALATGSHPVADANGWPDGQQVPMDFAFANARRIAEAVDVPLTVDFESAYSADPEEGGENVRRNLERVRCWPFRHLPVIRAEHVSQFHAENGITPRANRRTRTGAVEAEERREPVARRDRSRDVPVSNDLQRQRLARPLFRTPYPRLRPVLDAHGRWIRERIRHRRLRRPLSLSLSLS